MQAVAAGAAAWLQPWNTTWHHLTPQYIILTSIINYININNKILMYHININNKILMYFMRFTAHTQKYEHHAHPQSCPWHEASLSSWQSRISC
jgi:hypothetical protein